MRLTRKDNRPYPKRGCKAWRWRFAFVPASVEDTWVWLEYYVVVYDFYSGYLGFSWDVFEYLHNPPKLPQRNTFK